MTARGAIAAAGLGLVLTLWTGCATRPPSPSSAPAGPRNPTVQAPSPDRPSAPGPLRSGWQRGWIAAAEWEGFASSLLWPQEWALRHWHRWTSDGTSLQLSPEGPLPEAPVPRVQGTGNDPALWMVDFPEPVPGPRQGSVRQITFPWADSGPVSPSVHALRTLLKKRTGAGLVRVSSVHSENGRVTVTVLEASSDTLPSR